VRDVAVLAFAQTPSVRRETSRNEVEMLMPILQQVVRESGLAKSDIGFTVSGSCDYLAGQPFAFVSALDAVGAWPPIAESHVEMDGAWALYEAWVKIQTGEVDSALIYAFGKSSMGDLPEVLTIQLDPYYVAPLWPDAISLAALQARAYLEASGKSERDLAEVAARSRRAAADNPNAQLRSSADPAKLLESPYLVAPLRKHDCPPISDGASAIVLAAGDLVKKSKRKPVWIRGIDHRIEAHGLGTRDLARSRSTKIAGERAGVGKAPVDFAELHAPFTHQELILREALGLGPSVTINPSGGALAANPMMVAGLSRIGEAATRLAAGNGKRAVAHATSGPCLQQNLVCVLEAE
jgi:acetyl-CoA acetyltransferase